MKNLVNWNVRCSSIFALALSVSISLSHAIDLDSCPSKSKYEVWYASYDVADLSHTLVQYIRFENKNKNTIKR